MRVWIPVTTQQVSEFKASNVLVATSGYAVTEDWAQSWDETDPEVLEAEILQAAGTESRLVVVAECLAEVQNSESGQIAISNPIPNPGDFCRQSLRTRGFPMVWPHRT